MNQDIKSPLVGLAISIIFLTPFVPFVACDKRDPNGGTKTTTQSSETFQILKLAVQMCSNSDCGFRQEWGYVKGKYTSYNPIEGKAGYRIFTLGTKSNWSIPAEEVGINISETGKNHLTVVSTTTHIKPHTMFLPPQINHSTKYTLNLVPCSTYRVTNQYLIKYSTDTSTGFLGFARKNSESKEWELEADSLEIPCLID